MAKSMGTVALTSFLDGFACSGLFSRKRWYGAPAVGFAPCAMPSDSRVGISQLLDTDAEAKLSALVREIAEKLEQLSTTSGEKAKIEAVLLDIEGQLRTYLASRNHSALPDANAVLRSLISAVRVARTGKAHSESRMKHGFQS
jgi:hypothetical protein